MIKNLGFLGYPHYAVTVTGEVYSILSERFLQKTKGPYPRVTLVHEKQKQNWMIHRLVALAFLDNSENKPQVNHIDGDTRNNHLSNLEWVTASENSKHASQTGLIRPELRHRAPRREGGDELVHKICRFLEDGLRVTEIADMLGVKQSFVSKIKHKTVYHDITCQYDLDRLPKKCRMSVSKLTRICELLASGKNVSQTAKEIGCSAMTVWHIYKRNRHTTISCGYHW